MKELEQAKQQYLSFHKKRTDTYPKLSTTDDSIEIVNMSTRLYRYLMGRDIIHLSDYGITRKEIFLKDSISVKGHLQNWKVLWKDLIFILRNYCNKANSVNQFVPRGFL